MKKFIKLETKTNCLSIKRKLAEYTLVILIVTSAYLSRTYPYLMLAKLIARLYK